MCLDHTTLYNCSYLPSNIDPHTAVHLQVLPHDIVIVNDGVLRAV